MPVPTVIEIVAIVSKKPHFGVYNENIYKLNPIRMC